MMAATKTVFDKATGQTSRVDVVCAADEGNRPDTTAEGLASLAGELVSVGSRKEAV